MLRRRSLALGEGRQEGPHYPVPNVRQRPRMVLIDANSTPRSLQIARTLRIQSPARNNDPPPRNNKYSQDCAIRYYRECTSGSTHGYRDGGISLQHIFLQYSPLTCLFCIYLDIILTYPMSTGLFMLHGPCCRDPYRKRLGFRFRDSCAAL